MLQITTSVVLGLTVQRRKWRILGLLNTEATRDVANADNRVIWNIEKLFLKYSQINITIPVTMEMPFQNGAVVYEEGQMHKFGVNVMSWQVNKYNLFEAPSYPLELLSEDKMVVFEAECKREGYTDNNLPGTNQPVPTGVS